MVLRVCTVGFRGFSQNWGVDFVQRQDPEMQDRKVEQKIFANNDW